MKLTALIAFITINVLSCRAQKFLAVDLYRLGHFKRIRIYQNTPLTYKLKDSRTVYTDTISDMKDSILFLRNGDYILFGEIKTIYLDRSNWLTRKLYKTGIYGSIFIVAIDAANNIGNQRPTIVDKPFIIVGSAMMASGFIIKWLCKRRIRPGKNTVFKIIDLSPR